MDAELTGSHWTQGSVARDHLAGERTYLAWLRTSLSLVSLGIAIAQLFKLPELTEPSGGDEDELQAGSWVRGTPLDALFFQSDGSVSRLESLERL